MALATARKYSSDRAAPAVAAAVALQEQVIVALRTAIRAIAADDVGCRCAAVSRATEAVTLLYLDLEIRNGRETVEDLAWLYGRLLAHLTAVNLRNDAASARATLDLLASLSEPWRDTAAIDVATLHRNLAGKPEAMMTSAAAEASPRHAVGAGHPG